MSSILTRRRYLDNPYADYEDDGKEAQVNTDHIRKQIAGYVNQILENTWLNVGGEEAPHEDPDVYAGDAGRRIFHSCVSIEGSL